MNANVGLWDRIIRAILGLGALFSALNWFDWTEGKGLVLTIVGFLLLATSILSFCPMYRLLGISTCKAKPGTPHADKPQAVPSASQPPTSPENPS